MRRKRHQRGSIKKRCGKWVGQWREDGKRRNRVLGEIRRISKSAARSALAKIIAEVNASPVDGRVFTFGEFVREVYFPYYRRKWKQSTTEANIGRISFHLVSVFDGRQLGGFRRDELQDLLDEKTRAGLSFSVVDHLRWDLRQVFEMAVAEGCVPRNPAALLFTPSEAAKPVRRVMTLREVQLCFSALAKRERLIAKLAVIAGMRPGEIFALTWGRLTATYADIRQRVYRGLIDKPKTDTSIRKAALSEGLLVEIEQWRLTAVDTGDDAWVFPSERLTPLSRDNCWRRSMRPVLAQVGLGWATFQVMRRTHACLMKALGVDGKLVADQLGHTLDVNQNVYTQSSVEIRQVVVNQLEESLKVM